MKTERPWVRAWRPDIEKREPAAWAAFVKTYGENGTYREWTVFLVGWRMAREQYEYSDPDPWGEE